MTGKLRLLAYLTSVLVLATVNLQGNSVADEQFAVTSIIQLPADQSLASFDIGFVDSIDSVKGNWRQYSQGDDLAA
jgi:hypothetical protein